MPVGCATAQATAPAMGLQVGRAVTAESEKCLYNTSVNVYVHYNCQVILSWAKKLSHYKTWPTSLSR